MKTMYRTNRGFGDRIEAVKVIKETDHFVVLANGRGREAKRSDWRSYFNTPEEVHDYLLTNARNWIEGLESQLQRARLELAAIQDIDLSKLSQPAPEEAQ